MGFLLYVLETSEELGWRLVYCSVLVPDVRDEKCFKGASLQQRYKSAFMYNSRLITWYLLHAVPDWQMGSFTSAR
jgi:hypothetical protein